MNGDALFELAELDDPGAFEARLDRASGRASDARIPSVDRSVAPSRSGSASQASAARHSAAEIAERLGLPTPTRQQQAVIEAPLEPAIVVAGAGSGKTETMANRVVWLVANGLVRESEVLGLTFTRKAAGELAERIRRRLAELALSGLVERESDPFQTPVISTYNAFANGIYRENATVIGRESEAAVLSEASAWQLTRSVVVGSSDERLLKVDRQVDAVTSAVLALSRALAENVADAGAVGRYADRFAALAELPTGSSRVRDVYAPLRRSIEAVAPLPLVLALAEEYAAEKVRRGYVEFSDQIALALAVAESSPAIVADYRDRSRVVLLDEYQDTSVVQTRLLARLFAGHAVMAVGDPHQSIYGWRGASAANLARFATDFGASGEPFALSTSWRNPTRVLDAANALVTPLTAESAVVVESLQPRPGAGEGSVDTAFAETVTEEADAVASWFQRRLAAAEPPTAALLCRSVKKIEPFTAALERRGIPYHVLGLGGLLMQPAVADLVSTLRVLYHPTAGADLLRVLGGARWRIGVRDLAALRALASWIAERDHRFQKLEPAVAGRIRGSVVADEDRSIVDALDFVATAPEGHSALEGFSPVGLDRLRRAGAQLAELRTRAGLGLVDFVDLVQQELLLDVEVLASPHAAEGRAALDAFSEQLVSFLALDPSSGLGDFLAWLEEAEKRERLEPRSDPAEPGTVQILTIHGAKGLEWDLVAVPRMVEGELPGDPRSKLGWLAFGELPYDFRGDRAELPMLDWQGIETQTAFGPVLEEFREANAEHYAAEQRRLAYVAVTRARDALLVSGSFWSTGVTARPPSRYLHELAEAGVVEAEVLPDRSEHEQNPLAETESWVSWPREPLGTRRGRMESAAALVEGSDPAAPTPWDSEIELLLAERADRMRAARLDVPVRIPASRFKDYVADPQAVLRTLRRPMPERPFRQTRLGTRFHSWVENRFRDRGGELLAAASPSSGDLDAFADELEFDDDDLGDDAGASGASAPGVSALESATWRAADELDDDERRLAELIATFERSEFAERDAVEVERELHLVLGGRIVVCKIDAIFAEGDGFLVVDWKTGKAPRDEEELQLKQLQLALYRLAYARWAGIDVERVDACFYFVSDDAVVRPTMLDDEAELERLVRSTLG
ncbi:ATP-dependent helicase [Herbiconiux moechotypicola]|uniref:DNA 3'-5' helicase n=1 Tax=Herbiconiux moechotypicola TaxID=637393 RepID=A0ABN3DMY3_9MICO|nr:ATP-dependent DNA helicase [Herbiconiux moechotypicola]MCS5730329.1 ATP-dependent helicase [Herbiconiux moechotypicola]